MVITFNERELLEFHNNQIIESRLPVKSRLNLEAGMDLSRLIDFLKDKKRFNRRVG
jgi:hypothetical protein